MAAASLPAPARRWVERVCGAPPGPAIRLAGASTAAVEAFRAGGRRLVIKRFVHRFFVEEDPGRAGHEAALLDLLGPTPVPAPGLVAVDRDGSEAGVPAVLMEHLPGRRTVPNPCPRATAEMLAEIHGIAPGVPYTFRRHLDGVEGVSPPSWARRAGLWERAIERAAGPGPQSAIGLIHRDANDGNLLWDGPRVTGVVDWLSGCRGPLGVDLARVRVDLALRGEWEAASEVLAAYRRVGAQDAHHPHWDVVDALDLLPYYRGRDAVAEWTGPAGNSAAAAAVRRGLERFLGEAMAELG